MVAGVTEDQPDQHASTLDAIRATYAAYSARGRYRLWDTGNPGFARISQERAGLLVSLLRRSLDPRTGASILDLGCGNGDAARLLAANAPDARYVGVDLMPELVHAARQRYPHHRFEVASAHALPFDDGEFDVVLALTLFSSLPSRLLEHAVAAEVSRVLRDEGWLIWYDLRYRSPQNRSVHALPPKRIRALFPGWRAELRTVTLIPPLARRLGWTTEFAYPLLLKIPPLRSHLMGRLQRPKR